MGSQVGSPCVGYMGRNVGSPLAKGTRGANGAGGAPWVEPWRCSVVLLVGERYVLFMPSQKCVVSDMAGATCIWIGIVDNLGCEVMKWECSRRAEVEYGATLLNGC